MAFRRGGEAVSRRQFDWHKRHHSRLLGHPGYQALNFERKGIYNHLYDLAALANDDGAIRIGPGPRLSRRRVVEFLAMQQAGAGGDPGPLANWARLAVDALVSAGLVVVDGEGVLWMAMYADEQSISPASVRQRERRERERAEAGGGGVGTASDGQDVNAPAFSSIEERRGPRTVRSGPAPLTRTADRFDDPFDTGSKGGDRDMSVTRARCHDQNQKSERGANAPQNSESDSDGGREAGADGRPRFDAAAFGGAGPERTVRGDIYALPIVDACCQVIGNHGAWAVNTARKVVRELGEQATWAIVGEVNEAWKDGVVKSRDKSTGRLTGGPLFNHIANKHREARAGISQAFGPHGGGQHRPPIGFGP